MAERMDKRETVSLEELTLSNVYQLEALVLLLDEKGILTVEELIEKINELRVAKEARAE